MIKKVYVSKTDKDFKKEPASEKHFSRLIEGEADIIDTATGKVVVATRYVPETKQLTPHLRRIKYDKSARTSGLPTISKVFGYYPRIKIRNDYCHEGILAIRDSKANSELYKMAGFLEKIYNKLNPDLYSKHKEVVKTVLDEWRIRGGGIYLRDRKQEQSIALPQRRWQFQRVLGSNA